MLETSAHAVKETKLLIEPSLLLLVAEPELLGKRRVSQLDHRVDS
jgi:hypothetical protein